MAYPLNTATVLAALGYSNFEVRDIGGVISIHHWGETDPKPTDQQVTDYANDVTQLPNGQLFSEWLAEHGGDAILTAKRKAKEALDDRQEFLLTVDRAILELTRKYVNETRTAVNDIGVAYVNLTNYLDGLAGVTIPENAKLTGLQPLVNKTQQEAIDSVKTEVENA